MRGYKLLMKPFTSSIRSPLERSCERKEGLRWGTRLSFSWATLFRKLSISSIHVCEWAMEKRAAIYIYVTLWSRDMHYYAPGYSAPPANSSTLDQPVGGWSTSQSMHFKENSHPSFTAILQQSGIHVHSKDIHMQWHESLIVQMGDRCHHAIR